MSDATHPLEVLRDPIGVVLEKALSGTGVDADDVTDAVLAILEEAALERMAQQLLKETKLRAMDFRNGASTDIEPAQEIAAAFVAAARTLLGDAPNYIEARAEMGVRLTGDPEKFVFTLQRAGKLTPHEARQRAEARLEASRQALAAFDREEVCGAGGCIWEAPTAAEILDVWRNSLEEK